MARQWQSGFELQSTTALMEFDTVSGSPTIDTSDYRSGVACGRFNATGTAKYVEHRVSSGSDLYFSAHVKFASFPGSTATFFQLRDSGGNGQWLEVTSGGVVNFIAGDGTTNLGSTGALTLNKWYNFQISGLEFSGTTQQQGRIDGVVIGTTTVAFSGQAFRIGVLSAVTMDIRVDDIIVNSQAGGGSESTWPSIHSRIIHLQPNAAGDSNTFEKSGGGAGDANNYQDVDEITPDNATTFVTRDTGASNQPKDLYLVESPYSAGIGIYDTIVCVAVGGRGGSNSATSNAGRNINWGLKSGGTEAWSGSVDMSINGYTTNKDPVPRTYQYVAYVDPSDSAVWTPPKLASVQIGARANAASTLVLSVTTVWMSVEFISRARMIRPIQAVNRASTY